MLTDDQITRMLCQQVTLSYDARWVFFQGCESAIDHPENYAQWFMDSEGLPPETQRIIEATIKSARSVFARGTHQHIRALDSIANLVLRAKRPVSYGEWVYELQRGTILFGGETDHGAVDAADYATVLELWESYGVDPDNGMTSYGLREWQGVTAVNLLLALKHKGSLSDGSFIRMGDVILINFMLDDMPADLDSPEAFEWAKDLLRRCK